MGALARRRKLTTFVKFRVLQIGFELLGFDHIDRALDCVCYQGSTLKLRGFDVFR